MSLAAGIVGLGRHVPPTVRGNDYWADRLRPRDDAQRARDILALERRASGAASELPPEIVAAMAGQPDDLFRGAKLRHVLDPGADVADMEVAALESALADAAISPEQVDVLMVHSLPGDRLVPSNAPAIQSRCRLSRAAAFSVDAGCASLQPQLMAASAMISSGLARVVALVQSQTGSRSVDLETPAGVGFGDGAAAAIVAAVPAGYGLLGHYVRTDGDYRDGVVLAPVVDGRPIREWWLEHRGVPRLASFDTEMGKLAGLRAPDFVREACHGALARAGLAVADVDLFVCTQSVGWFVDACRRSLGIAPERTVDTFADVANIGAAAVLYNLFEARNRGLLRDASTVLAYAPGAGFTLSAVVMRWHDPSRSVG